MRNVFILFAFFLKVAFGAPIDFSRDYFGVRFSPYVKSASDNITVLNPSDYTFEELKTMLKVVSSKFSTVGIESLGSFGLPYTSNQTYFNAMDIIGRTAEAAAIINQEKRIKRLSVYIGIPNYDEDLDGRPSIKTLWEVRLALEAAQIANRIYPETVVGFHFSLINVHEDIWTKTILHWTDYVRRENRHLPVQFGMMKDCGSVRDMGMYNSEGFSTSDSTNSPQNKALQSLDFIVCVVQISKAIYGAKNNIPPLSRYMIHQKLQIQAINPNIKVMGLSTWESSGQFPFQNLLDFRDFWFGVNELAVSHKFFMWMFEAMDNPLRKTLLGDFGWWKLQRNELSMNESGYVEKVAEIESDRGNKYDLNEQNKGNITFHSSNYGEYDIDVSSNDSNKLDRNTSTAPGSDISTNSHIPQFGWIVIGVALGAVVVAVSLGFLCHMYRRVRHLRNSLTEEDIEEFVKGKKTNCDKTAYESALGFPYDRTLEIAKHSLEIHWHAILGCGEFGCVFKATIRRSTGLTELIALKTTKDNSPVTAIKGILSEIKILSYLGQHPNIVSICGAYTAELSAGKVYLATELCALGSLKGRLVKMQKENETEGSTPLLNFENLLRWSLEIARGMSHLSEKKVIHADLATRNVLLTTEGVAKITDFGLSRRLYDYSKYKKKQQDPLPWKWMAIESLKKREFTLKSDVWSYGVTLWEIFSLGDQPYPGVSWSYGFNDDLEKGKRLYQPKYATNEIYQVMMKCWELEPEKRPEFNELRNIFETKDVA